MPELPEVETIARQLRKVLVGQEIKDLKVLRKKSFRGFEKRVVGKKIVGVGRKAKVLIIKLSGRLTLLIHLKMTGQLVYQGSEKKRVVGGHPTADWVRSLPSKHTRLMLELSRGRLFFNDMRVFGWMKVVEKKDLNNEFKSFGPDVTDKKGMNKKYFYEVLQSSGRAVKSVIMDQTKLAGVGNIYANDGLFWAGIDPKKAAKRVTKKESDRLLLCLQKVMDKGIKCGGASESDFVQISGMGGKYQEHFLVYKRDGKTCRSCSGEIKKIKIGGRGTYYCPKCQK